MVRPSQGMRQETSPIILCLASTSVRPEGGPRQRRESATCLAVTMCRQKRRRVADVELHEPTLPARHGRKRLAVCAFENQSIGVSVDQHGNRPSDVRLLDDHRVGNQLRRAALGTTATLLHRLPSKQGVDIDPHQRGAMRGKQAFAPGTLQSLRENAIVKGTPCLQQAGVYSPPQGEISGLARIARSSCSTRA